MAFFKPVAPFNSSDTLVISLKTKGDQGIIDPLRKVHVIPSEVPPAYER